MLASPSASTVVAAPALPPTSRVRRGAVAARASRTPRSSEDKEAASRGASSSPRLDRRAFARRALGAATLGAALVAGVDVSPASAFGSGIPGYDINEKAREAQRSAIKDELAEQRELARIEKERRRAAREAAEAEAAAKAEAEAGAAQ